MMKRIFKIMAALGAAIVFSGVSAAAAERSSDVNCNGKADYFDVSVVKENILESGDDYNVFDVIRLKNEVLDSDSPQPESSSRTSIHYENSEGRLTVKHSRNTVNLPMGEDGTWTVFVYMCGSNLESEDGQGTQDITEMLAASRSDNIKFVVETGGSVEWHGYDIRADRLQRYVISGGEITLAGEKELADMGQSSTLADFLKWGVSEYPAENMGLILWNHGGGAVMGVCYDENFTDSYDNCDTLLLRELDAALLSASEYMTDTFTFIGFDACLMSTLETANIVASYADYMYASEEVEPINGWNYTDIVEWLEDDPHISGDVLGKLIAEKYFKYSSEDGYDDISTFSVTDLTKTDALVSVFDRFASDLAESCDSRDVLYDIIYEVWDSDHIGNEIDNMIDLNFLASAGKKYSQAAEELSAAIENAVVFSISGYEHENVCGLSVYFPLTDGNEVAQIVSGFCPGPNYMELICRVLKEYASLNFTHFSGRERIMSYNGDFTYTYSRRDGTYVYRY